MVPERVLLAVYLLFSLVYNTSGLCDKTPIGAHGPRTKNFAGRYIIEIPGNPKTYTPYQRYNITLKAPPNKRYSERTFKNFVITVESAENENDEPNVGEFDLGNENHMLARFSSHCPNTVVESSVVPKSEIQVFWTAPPKDSGCVVIKAAVVELKGDWFSDDEYLTKLLCEEKAEDANTQPPILKHCCACQEAKYEVAFEGKWTRNTHPRHFPLDHWNTKFSDVIGASHQLYHAFWNYEDYASEGLKEIAEAGITKTLESELKNNSQHIRTIIKARGLQFPNITKSTYAVFRVDNKNHLVSIVSKIIPSPDWIVGVSNFELCKPDCTWEDSRTLNLYPWDIGTNDALGYKSPPVPVFERHPIRRITANNPNNPDSPFYSEDGEAIKPVAKLHLTRQRLYDKVCDDNDFTDQSDCATSEWSEWSACSATCGKGLMFRKRTLRDESQNCDVKLTDVGECYGRLTYCQQKLGEGQSESETEEPLTNTEAATESKTENKDSSITEEDPNCPGTFWSDWSPCNVSCGHGHKSRSRLRNNNTEDEAPDDCFKLHIAECQGECNTEKEGDGDGDGDGNGDGDGDGNGDGNGDGVTEIVVVSPGPDGEVIDCEVSAWSKWSKCHLDDDDATCGEGKRYRIRQILEHPRNGGKSCPKDILKEKPCRISCVSTDQGDKCIMGRWSNWTPCSSNCGGSAVQIRTRKVIYQPKGVDCDKNREDIRHCPLPLACSENGEPIF